MPKPFDVLALVLLATGGIAAPASSRPEQPAAASLGISGTWRLLIGESRFWKPERTPLARIDRIQAGSDEIEWAWDSREPKGPFVGRMLLPTDGGTRTNAIAGLKVKSRGGWHGDTLSYISSGSAMLVPFKLEDRIWLEPCGTRLRAVRTFRMATIHAVEHWVFERLEESADGGNGGSMMPAGATAAAR
jgi:hypothetical protein